MAKAYIRRIRKIGAYRVFQNWVDDHRADDFKRVNVFYGQNGSGKSTLAALLRECAAHEPTPPSVDLVLQVDLAGSTTEVTETTEAFWSRLRVFNSDYVAESLRFDDVDGPSPDSLLTLGKPNVDAELELRSAIDRMAEVQPALAAAKYQAQRADRQLVERLTELAREVVDHLRESPVPAYRATNTYTKANVRTLLDGDQSAFEDASTDVPKDRATSLAKVMPAPGLPPCVELSGDVVLVEATRILNSNVVVQVIDSLKERSDRASWVQQGIPLHDGVEECLFCGQELTQHRRDELASHFDNSLVKLQEEIDELIETLRRAVSASRDFLNAIPDDGRLYPELIEEARSAKAEYAGAHAEFVARSDVLIEALTLKRANPFKVAALPESFRLAAPTRADVEAIVARHSGLIDSHDDAVATAARRVELAVVGGFRAEYSEKRADIATASATVSELAAELAELEQKVVALQNVGSDPVPSATELTTNVARLLGRADLVFATAGDGKHYLIERNGEPATNLSEGERTAIALLHFLLGVREDVTLGEEPIVVVDDPVSSLDDSILFGASSYLWSELVVGTFVSQVFLLTHNFELFRQWVVSLENAGKHLTHGYTVHEIRARYRDDGGRFRRLPQLDPWTKDKPLSRSLRSQYHFLFARVADAVILASPGLSLAEQMNVLALMPNAARKMLESFLSFRYPNKMGDFHGGMRLALGKVTDQSIRVHVERYLHAYSHNGEGDISAVVDPSEATAVLRSLFQMMKSVDEEHFTSMCEALEIDAEALVIEPGKCA